jgi:hypothetical protein
MAEAEEERGTALEVVGADGRKTRSEPERARGGAKKRLKQAAEKALDDNVPLVVTCLLTSIGQNHVTGAKMLIELADGPEDEDEALGDGYPSLAEVLWKELEDGEREPGNRE